MKIPFFNSRDSEAQQEITMVEIDRISPNPYQPREGFADKDIIELAESIKNFGLIQPLTVRPRGEEYELIAGERRLRASKYLGYEKIPAIIKDFNNQEAGEIALVENLQRKDLHFIEESMAYSTLLEEFDITQEELAEKLGKSQSTIANKLRILTLPLKVRKKLKTAEISERHARALLKLNDSEEQLEVIQEIIQKGLTVRETGKLIEKKNKKEKQQTGKVVTVCEDIRIFTNTLQKTIREMKEAGLEVKVEKKTGQKYVEYKLKLPRRQKGGSG